MPKRSKQENVNPAQETVAITRDHRDARGLLLPGNPNAWTPGKSGNPAGRPVLAERQVTRLARQLSLEGIEALAEVMRNSRAPAVARVRAVEVILERAYGKAPQRVTMTTDTAGLDNPQLQSFLQEALLGAARTIEHAPEEDEQR